MTQLTEYTLTALMSLTANTDKITETCSKEQILFLLLNSVHLLHQVRAIIPINILLVNTSSYTEIVI